MKKLFLTLTAVGALASTVYAQGRVNFASAGFGPADAITVGAQNQGVVGGTAGSGIGGDKYTVQLVWAAGTGLTQAQLDANRVFGSPVTGVGSPGNNPGAFYGVTGPTAGGGGYFDAGAIPNPVGTSMPAGLYTAQVYAWYSGVGGQASYDAAKAAGNINVGQSALFTINAGASPTPITATSFAGFTVGVVPEPSSLALAGLGAAAMLMFRRKK